MELVSKVDDKLSVETQVDSFLAMWNNCGLWPAFRAVSKLLMQKMIPRMQTWCKRAENPKCSPPSVLLEISLATEIGFL